jgi:drug/metabolite transporter (DMT)-like permease
MNWVWIALFSAILSAAAAITQKKVLFSLSPIEFSFYLSLVLLVFSIWIPFSPSFTTPNFHTILILTIKSIIGAGGFLLVMVSLHRNDISSALPLLGTTPIATAVLAYIAIGEALLFTEWIGIGLMLVGAYIIEKKPTLSIWNSLKASRTHNIIWIAVLFFAVSSVLDRILLARLTVHPLVVFLYQNFIYALVFGCAFLWKRYSFKSLARTAHTVVPLIIAIALFTFGYRFAQLEATRLAPVALVLAIKRTSILFATLIGGKLFSEERYQLKLAGATLIVIGGFFIIQHLS